MVLYTGPRNQAEPEKVKLDIASDEVTTDQPVRQPIIHRYQDQSDALSLPTYGLVEVASEKLRCVIQRLQCRDLFDIHRLFAEEGVDVEDAWNQFTIKAGHRGLDPHSLPGRWQVRVEAYGKRWDREMRRYTGRVPPFDKILREVERALRPVLKV